MPEDSTSEEVTSDGADERASTVLGDAEQAIEDARRRLAEVPAEVVVTNHVMGLYELAAIHLSADTTEPAQRRLGDRRRRQPR